MGRTKVSLIDPFHGKESCGSERKWPLSCLTPCDPAAHGQASVELFRLCGGHARLFLPFSLSPALPRVVVLSPGPLAPSPLCCIQFLPSHTAFTSLRPSPQADNLQPDFSPQTSLFPFISSWHPPMGFSCPSPGDHPMPVSSLKKPWSQDSAEFQSAYPVVLLALLGVVCLGQIV